MSKKGSLQGAPAFTHALKEYGYGKSMYDGVKRIKSESKQEGFQAGIDFALHRLSLAERILGRKINRK